jgi:nucleoside-diphosphate-sugar epimerase
MKKILVTGGSGKAGKATINKLSEKNYDVFNVDLQDKQELDVPFSCVNLENFGETVEAITQIDDRINGIDAIVHQAAIPAPGLYPNHKTFRVNMLSTYNVFQCAEIMKINNIVWASSETVLGLPFDTYPPYVPVDEDYPPRPESSYSLSKVMGEELARQYCRRNKDMKIFGLRYSNIMEEKDYESFRDFQEDPYIRKWNFWGYIDSRDVGQACLLALESDLKGADIFIIAADDTVMNKTNKELLDAVFPNIKIKGEISDHQTLLNNSKAKKILGFQPRYSWRDLV